MKECDEIMKLHKELLNSEKHPFTPKGTAVKVSDKHGVYIIYSPNDEVLHVGISINLNKRLNEHRNIKSSFSRNYLKPKSIDLSKSYMFKYIEVENSKERAFLEALSIGLLCPKYIGIGEKA